MGRAWALPRKLLNAKPLRVLPAFVAGLVVTLVLGTLSAAESSQTELTALQTALRKAESSLMSLELSFAACRQTAETRINTLERQNRLWKWGCIAAGVLAVGFGTAFLARNHGVKI